MRRLAALGTGVVLVSVAAALPAQVCFTEAPSVAGGKGLYQVVTPTPLSKDDVSALEKLFERLEGRWAGNADGYFCRGTVSAPRKEDDDYRIAMETTAEGVRQLQMTSDLTAKSGGIVRTERLRLFIADDKLRVNRSDAGGDVELLELSSSGDSLAFLEKQIDRSREDFTEIVRRIEVSGPRLTIVHEIYFKGGLDSSSTWKLEKK